MTELSRLQGAEIQRSDTDAFQLLDQEAEVFEHVADLIGTSFNEPDLIPGIFGAARGVSARQERCAGRRAEFRCGNLLSLIGRERPVHLYQVDLRDVALSGVVRTFARSPSLVSSRRPSLA